jgi:hypothetical protein
MVGSLAARAWFVALNAAATRRSAATMSGLRSRWWRHGRQRLADFEFRARIAAQQRLERTNRVAK